ncbi:MAG: ATP-dependent Clp protease ATP-binding subunit [Patescibacteria group bacterium]
MDFQKSPPLNILTNNKRAETRMGVYLRSKWLYWNYPLTRYNIALQRGRRILNKIRVITALVFTLTCWIWVGFGVYKSGQMVFSYLFYLGVIGLLYLWYRVIKQGEFTGMVERFEYEFDKQPEKDEGLNINVWDQIKRVPWKKRLNITETFTAEAMSALGSAYKLADKYGKKEVGPIDLFLALLKFNRIGNIFIRLGIPASVFEEQISKLELTEEKIKSAPVLSADFQQIIFQAYEEAYNAHQEYVSVTELLICAVKESPEIQEIMFALDINNQKLANVIEWARIRERLHRQYVKFARAASHRSKYGMDKAMTALATPYLNQFSDDLTLLAQFGHLNPCVARVKEIEEIYRVVEGGQHNVLLVGDHGVGKRSIVEGVAQSMVADDVPDRLKDKRMVRLSVSALLGGTDPAGAVDRLRNIMHEISRARNVILFIHNIHELIGVSAGGQEGSLDVADTLAEFLTSGRFLTVATTTNEDFAKHIANSTMGNVFTKIDVPEMDVNQAIQVLESKVGEAEYKQNVFFSYDAIEKAAQFSAKFIHEIYLPGSALEIMTEAASFAHNKKGANTLVTGEEVAAVIAEKTKIPLTTVSSDESTKLLNLEAEMHKRVIGQDEGVDAVASSLRRARAEIRSAKRPIANFLFLGPTGVGKTELAKTIAEVYFGGEDRMIRLDMSEYQEKSGLSRLIGAAGQKGSGILTESVRRHPFALLLLDEIEKADPDILNLFLQVMDDGRLSDSTGRAVDFTNIILIATSNAGTSYVSEQMRAGLSQEAIKERLLHGELKQYFRPEFLNRFDGIILFKPLDKEAIQKVAGLMLQRIVKELEVKGVQMKVEDGAISYLAEAGFDPEFGARPMRRVLQERVENKLADLLLAGKLKRRDTVVIGEGGNIRVE